MKTITICFDLRVRVFSLASMCKKDSQKTTTAGFEPARAKPNRFLVCLLNHSDKLSCISSKVIPIYGLWISIDSFHCLFNTIINMEQIDPEVKKVVVYVFD